MTDYKFTDGIVLIHKGGHSWGFKDIYDAVNKLSKWGLLGRWNRDYSFFGNHFTPITKYNYETHTADIIGYVEYIMRTEFGEVITVHDMEKAHEDQRVSRRLRYYEIDYERAKRDFRCAPAPHTRCRRGGGGYYRNISTFPEHRDNEALLRDDDAIEYDVKPRAKRAAMNLPNSWDDICRTDWDNKNWKRHRKTQWKEKK